MFVPFQKTSICHLGSVIISVEITKDPAYILLAYLAQVMDESVSKKS